MKIIALSTDENILNQGSRTYSRIREYAKLFDEYYCLVFTKNNNFKIIEDTDFGKFKVIPIFGKNKFLQIKKLIELFEIAHLKKDLQDFVISSQDAFELGAIAVYLKYKYNLKLQIQMHTDISTKFFKNESLRNFAQYKIAKKVLREADTIRVVSNKMRNYLHLKLKIPFSKIHFLPIFTDTTHFTLKLKKPQPIFKKQGSINVLMISRIEEVKNIPLGVRSVQAFRKLSGRSINLKIVGQGNLKNKYLRLFKNKEWLSWADWTDDVEKEYHGADILLITSNYEGWGLTAVESVACGTPVVISPVGVANEFILNGINGYVARSHDVLSICEALFMCMNNEFSEVGFITSLEKLDNKENFLNKLYKSFT